MSNLFVVAYEYLATANQVREKLFQLSRQHLRAAMQAARSKQVT